MSQTRDKEGRHQPLHACLKSQLDEWASVEQLKCDLIVAAMCWWDHMCAQVAETSPVLMCTGYRSTVTLNRCSVFLPFVSLLLLFFLLACATRPSFLNWALLTKTKTEASFGSNLSYLSNQTSGYLSSIEQSGRQNKPLFAERHVEERWVKASQITRAGGLTDNYIIYSICFSSQTFPNHVMSSAT